MFGQLVLPERVIIAFGYFFSQGLSDARDVTVYPEAVEAPPGFKVVAGFSRVSEDAPIPIGTSATLSVVSQILTA